jgi:hypothetical protein
MSSESPDFDAIATRIYFEATGETLLVGEDTAPIVEQLRLVWNARGAADLAATEGVIDQSVHREALLVLLYGNGPRNPLTAAINKLDR